jgi:LPS-assembly protein
MASNLAQAQQASDPPLVLKPSSLLQEVIPQSSRKQLPTFVQSDAISGQTDLKTTLDGNVVIRRGDTLIKADHVDYDHESDLAKAVGNVYINRAGNVYQGPELNLYLDAFEGFFTQPTFDYPKYGGHGKAERIDFVDNANTKLYKADYTTCQRKPGPDWLPDWLIRADKISLDSDRNVGLAENAKLEFKDVTLLSASSIDFPLGDTRKSGLLPPAIGVDNIGGLQYSQPYYFDLAPNRDATITPTYWSKRGLQGEGEFRYLESSTNPLVPVQGLARVDYMSNDALRNNADRWGVQFSQTGLPNTNFAGGSLTLGLNLNRVSDDNYWKDFSLANGAGVQRLLSNDVNLGWSNGVWSGSLVVQRWQTLQDLADVINRITPPFDRAPQLGAQYMRTNVGGFDYSINTQVTRFEADRTYACAQNDISNCFPNGNREVVNLQLSRPFLMPAGYITPKVMLHSANYQFDTPLASTGQTSASVAVPTFSIDSGLVFERSSNVFDRAWTQTLEPRVLYVQTPFRDQNNLPNYDSGINSFNFASIFSENAFAGQDRVADAKMVVMGATSRLIDPNTGAEGARFAVAQRLRLQDQQVYLPGGAPQQDRFSDILMGASFNLSRTWSAESVIQYNPQLGSSTQGMVGARYTPSSYRTLTMAYLTQDDPTTNLPVTRQIDMGWQWPLSDFAGKRQDESLGSGRGLGEGRWYGVGRVSYSTLDHKPIESVIGFEYDAGCWLGRMVNEQLQIADGVSRQRLLFQLEFVGFSRVGTGALNSLKSNVPRYEPLRQPAATPSRFGDYE